MNLFFTLPSFSLTVQTKFISFLPGTIPTISLIGITYLFNNSIPLHIVYYSPKGNGYKPICNNQNIEQDSSSVEMSDIISLELL